MTGTMPLADHAAGYKTYSRRVLSIYDIVVLGISNRWIWRCPTALLERLYRDNLADTHLDIGVGTGYFLDNVPFPAEKPQITLLDPNSNCLDEAANRITRYQPKTVVGDALLPLPDMGRFGSIGLNYVLHCLPGTMAEKTVIFDHVIPHLEPNGVLFGSTIVHDDGVQGEAPRSFLARRLMAAYNAKGIFGNEQDTQAGLLQALEARFGDVKTSRHGCVVLFEARGPKA